MESIMNRGRRPSKSSNLLAREQAFVILNDSGVDESEHEHTQEERKQTSLWMKQNKAALRQFVKAMVLIEKNHAKRIAAKAFSVMFGKFWGYPMLIVADTEQAQELAQKLLRGEPVDTQAL